MPTVTVETRAREAWDEVGTVRVYVRLVDARRRFIKGNVTRTFTVAPARVSVVADTIERALRHRRRAQ